jgi:hypothetical protein
MMKEFAKKMKDNLDSDELKEDLKKAGQSRR